MALVICISSFIFLLLADIGGLNNAMKIACNNNMRHLSKAIILQLETNNSPFNDEAWCDSIKEEISFENTFKCHKDKTGPCSYAMNENIPADANELSPDLVLLFESDLGWNQVGGPDDVVTDRHGKPGANIAFADGHVEFVEADNIPALRWTMEQ